MTHAETEWQIDEAAYPHSGTPDEQMRFMLGYAILAPSSHNTQPWLFRLLGNGAELIADRTRCLPVVDPLDRALLISCGAALGHLRTAVRNFGHEAKVELFPEGSGSDVLARLIVGRPKAPSDVDRRRFQAITRRRTTRLRYADEPLPEGLAQQMIKTATTEGCELAVVEDAERKLAIAQLVAEGDQAQFADPAFRRELASWVHSRRSATRDGMSGANFGMPDILSAVGGLVIRTFDMGEGQGAKDEQLAQWSPALLVLATPDDEPESWLRTGLALSSILLDITTAGWTSAYLNQPVETATLRPRLQDAAKVAGLPQLLFRMGRAPTTPPAVRRPVDAILVT